MVVLLFLGVILLFLFVLSSSMDRAFFLACVIFVIFRLFPFVPCFSLSSSLVCSFSALFLFVARLFALCAVWKVTSVWYSGVWLPRGVFLGFLLWFCGVLSGVRFLFIPVFSYFFHFCIDSIFRICNNVTVSGRFYRSHFHDGSYIVAYCFPH